MRSLKLWALVLLFVALVPFLFVSKSGKRSFPAGTTSVENSLPTAELLSQTLGTRYYWAHKLAATTVAVDSTFDVKWEQCSIYSDTLEIVYRAGAPDVGSWSSRPWMLIPAGRSINFGPSTKLIRFEYKTKNGTGYIYLVGYKEEAQY